MTKTSSHGHMICIGNLGGVFSQENTPECHTDTHKNIFFPYKQVSERNSNHEWIRMTSVFILCDLLWNVQKSHAEKREGSFNVSMLRSPNNMISLDLDITFS